MKNLIFEFALRLIENVIIFSFFGSLLKSRFNSVFPVVLAIIATSAINYFCISLPIALKTLVSLSFISICEVVLYKDKLIAKTVYAFISLYVLFITDIVFGNIFSLVISKDIVEIFFSDFTYRFIFSLIIKAIDILVFYAFYRMLNRIDLNIKNKFWILFAIVVFGFLMISAIFLHIYPDTEQNSVGTALYTILSTLFFSMSLIIVYFFAELSKGFQRDSKLFLLENNFSALQEQIAVQQHNNETIQKTRHDIKNHLANIRSLLDNGEISDAVALLNETSEKVYNEKSETIDTGNNFVDAILLSKVALCKKRNIEFIYSVQHLKDLKIDVIDLSSLLSNLLDNAVEATIQSARPYIKLTIFRYNAYYTICVENNYKGKEFIKTFAGILISTKSNQALHGYGTQIISDIAKKYDGYYSWEAQDNKFVSTVIIKI